ncbi:aminodeoxychorismate synthase component I [Melittangium boletus]|uniref:aminodeoxychorismate synthase component I n=1 Tax=Melittangium boletus TaxID=83453 RepID=UPI003DA60432
MKTLLVDNYDSFTFNLYQLCAEVSGTPPLVVRNDVDWAHLQSLDFDQVVLSPGPGRPERAADFGVCTRLLQEATWPVLGVCLGHQGLGHVHGARVVHAPEVMHGRASAILHDGTGLFAGVPQGFSAVRYHSLMVTDLPACLERTAWTADGLVMGLRHRELPQWGVQFHPESIRSEHGRRLFENFQALSRAFLQTHRRPARAGPAPSLPAAEAGTRAPVTAERFTVRFRRLPLFPEPEAVFLHLFGEAPRAFWLDSSRVEPGLARFSFMGEAGGPEGLEVRYHVQPRALWVTRGPHTERRDESLFDYLRRELARRRVVSEALPFDFNGGFVGYLGYELKAECGGDAAHVSPLPDAHLLLADRLLAFDAQERVVYGVCLAREEDAAGAEAWLDSLEARLRAVPPAPPLAETPSGPTPEVQFARSRERYLADIAACQREIREGETYEVCLTNTLRTAPPPEPLAYYRRLRRMSPTPYAAFLRLGDTVLACSSPERFLRIDRAGLVESKPIKGTVARGRDAQEDARLEAALRASEKDRSENLMIVDLVRNDLGRVCEVGSVHVPVLMDVERYATVHQLVSTIRGRLRPESTAVDCIQAAFPGGSMTGAPKKRTLALLDRLEGAARGPYSGAIGFLGVGGGADLNIVIRTAVVCPEALSLGVGGAVVALSQPEAEWEELLLKARAPLAALARSRWPDPTPC